jgi:hypothetical protein
MKLKKLILGALFISLLHSCKTVGTLIEMKKKKAAVKTYTMGDKEIKFISMHHVGKQGFYDDVRKKVIKLKAEGYTVFYEIVLPSTTSDSITNDLCKRKMRKIKGFNGTYKENLEKIGFFKKYVQQPSNAQLGADTNDIRADVTSVELINEWEKQNGVIILDSVDLFTPFDGNYKTKKFYTTQQRDNIILGYRNSYLANIVKATSHKKILVLYGKRHRKGFATLLNTNN